MSRAACKAAIDGQALVVISEQADRSPEVRKVFDSRRGVAIVSEIAALCAELGGYVNVALGFNGEGASE